MRIIEQKLELLMLGKIKQINIQISNQHRYVHLMQIVEEFRDTDNYTTEELYEQYDELVSKKNHKFMHIIVNKDTKRIEVYLQEQILKFTGEPPLIDDRFALKQSQSSETIDIPNKKQTIKEKENKMARLQVFNKGKVQVEQIIAQIYIKNITEVAPFVLKIVNDELDKIAIAIKEEFPKVNAFKDCYNLKLLSAIEHINDFVKSNQAIDIETAYTYHTYMRESRKELNPKQRKDYSWIKEYLTAKNIQADEIDIFKSRKVEIYMKNGYIVLIDLKCGIQHEVSIKLDQSNDSINFHL